MYGGPQLPGRPDVSAADLVRSWPPMCGPPRAPFGWRKVSPTVWTKLSRSGRCLFFQTCVCPGPNLHGGRSLGYVPHRVNEHLALGPPNVMVPCPTKMCVGEGRSFVVKSVPRQGVPVTPGRCFRPVKVCVAVVKPCQGQ